MATLREVYEEAEHGDWGACDVRHPIYIPSKGRALTCQTPMKLIDAGLDVRIFVEQQDVAAYAERFGSQRLVTLHKSNQGIAYVRNAMKQHAHEHGHEYHWQVDDNITRWLELDSAGKRHEVDPVRNFARIEHVCKPWDNIGGASMYHHAFAFSRKCPVEINRQVFSCMLVRSDLPYSYRKGCIEDLDFSLQMLTGGWCTLLFTQWNMCKATSMAMKGGNTEIEYGRTGRTARAQGILRLWPEYGFKIRLVQGDPRIAPNRKVWTRFKQTLRIKHQ